MGQSQRISKPSKFQIVMNLKITNYLRSNGPKTKAHWDAVMKEVSDREKDLAVFGRTSQFGKDFRREKVS